MPTAAVATGSLVYEPHVEGQDIASEQSPVEPSDACPDTDTSTLSLAVFE